MPKRQRLAQEQGIEEAQQVAIEITASGKQGTPAGKRKWCQRQSPELQVTVNPYGNQCGSTHL